MEELDFLEVKRANYAKFGSVVRPEVMIRIVENSIVKWLDVDKYNEVIEKERKDMKKVEEFTKKLSEDE